MEQQLMLLPWPMCNYHNTCGLTQDSLRAKLGVQRRAKAAPLKISACP